MQIISPTGVVKGFRQTSAWGQVATGRWCGRAALSLGLLPLRASVLPPQQGSSSFSQDSARAGVHPGSGFCKPWPAPWGEQHVACWEEHADFRGSCCVCVCVEWRWGGLREGGLEIMPPFSGPSLAGLGGEPGWAGPVGKHAKHMLSGHCGLIVQ